MQTSYSKNYIKIYFFQILSIVLGFASMFVVIPYLSSDQTTYGIYSVCISVTIFLSYADLGFLGAGMKYASESYSRGELEKEMQFIGFSHFILLVFVLLLSGVFLFLSFNPDMLIWDLQSSSQREIAHKLLLVMSLFTPVVVGQRMLQMIFGIRLQEYKLQRVNIVGSCIKIASVFWFFTGGRYDIVGYYLFLQIVSLGVVVWGIALARRVFKYDFKYLFSHLKFSRSIFHHTKALAFISLFATLSWILYYELDSITLGKLLGAKSVAIYAIGLTLLGFVRSLFGVFFAPFSTRFNHFVGVNEIEQLRSFYLHVITITLPLVVFPLVALIIMAKGIVISWVGLEYSQSVVIVQWLMLCNIFGFVSYPCGTLMVAQEKLKEMYLINIMMPIIFWGGIFLTIYHWGEVAFAIWKFVAFACAGFYYLWYSMRFLQLNLMSFLRKVIFPYIVPLAILIVFLMLLQNVCITDKNRLNLLLNTIVMGSGVFLAFGVSLLTSKFMRDYVKKIINLIRTR